MLPEQWIFRSISSVRRGGSAWSASASRLAQSLADAGISATVPTDAGFWDLQGNDKLGVGRSP